MSSLITNATIQIRKDTAGNWTSNNPTPAAGELCLETDTKAVKIGDGSTAWTFLIYKIWPLSRSRATRSTTQAINNATPTTVIFPTEVYDNLGEYAIATGVFTALYTGYYQVKAAVMFANVEWVAGEYVELSLNKNDALYSYLSSDYAQATATRLRGAKGSDDIYLTAGQYINIVVSHNQGGVINLQANASYNYFSVHRLS